MNAAGDRVAIVSSDHLAAGRSTALSEFEFGMILAGLAFHRWTVRCVTAAGMQDMAITDVLVLHHICRLARERKTSDIAFILNIEDVHVVGYALKKLQSLGLVAGRKSGKEVLYCATEAGMDLHQRCASIRQNVLAMGLTSSGKESAVLGKLARFLRILSGVYDQAARSATSI